MTIENRFLTKFLSSYPLYKRLENNKEEFENKLSIKLGEEYKTFLKEFGTLEVEYLEFYGYFKDNKGDYLFIKIKK